MLDSKRVTIRIRVDKAVHLVPAALSWLVLLAWAAAPVAAQSVPPNEAWRTLETPHFRVVFPREVELAGRRAAGYAEQAWVALSDVFVEPPAGKINLLLTDHTDFSNGFARWKPYNQIVVNLRPPMEGMGLAYVDDWLENVVTHEVAHLFHMNRSGPVGSAIRSVFGRLSANWPVFPNFASPKWVVEGLATYYESLLTGNGRVSGSLHDMMLRTAALEQRLERLDQISGSSPTWPGGNTRYVYGSMFFDYLVSDQEPARIGDFAEAVSRQLVAHDMDRASRGAFGTSFSEAYSVWTASLERRALAVADSLAALAPITQIEALTSGSRGAFFPEMAPDGSRIAYVRADGRSDIQLRWLSPDGTEGGKIARVSNTTDFSWTPRGEIVAAQLESVGPYRLRSGLVRVSPDGSQSWIAPAARLDQPSVSPDGRSAVAVQDGLGTNRLVRVDLANGTVRPLTEFDPDVQWAYPEYSPDGRWIAVARREPGALYDLWIASADGELVTRITRDRSIDQAPAWSPDGRWVLWASDRSGIANIYAVAIDSAAGAGAVRQVTNVVTGVNYPSVSPDGRWVYVSVYGAEGWDIGRLPFDSDDWFDPFGLSPRFAGPGLAGFQKVLQDGPVRGYNPLPTLVPTFWEPDFVNGVTRLGRTVLKPALGVSTSQTDLVGRHSYFLSGAFRTDGRADLGASYVNRLLGDPVLSVAYSQFHSTDGPFEVTAESGSAQTLFRAERERALSVIVSTTRQRARSHARFSVAASRVWENRWLIDSDLERSPLTLERPNASLAELATTVTFSTARSQLFSTTTSDGVSGFFRARLRSETSLPDSLSGVRGRDRAFRDVIGRVSLFKSFSGPGFSNHGFALRGAFGHAWGAGADKFHFGVGGASGRPEGVSGLELFGGRSLFLPVRGYFEGARTGNTAWSAAVEYRFPLWNVHRGLGGLLPLHADRLSGAAFLDAGDAWGPEFPDLGEGPFLNPRRGGLASVGVELQSGFLFFFTSPLTVRVGLAHRLVDDGGDNFYVRVGTAF